MAREKKVDVASDDINELVNRLKQVLGLNNYESKLYLAILRGARTPSEASEKSGVPLPRVYDTVKSLESKGLVVKNGRWYVPLKPSEALNNIAASRITEAILNASAIRELGGTLENILEISGEKEPGFQVIRGLEKVFSHSLSLLENAKEAFFVLWKAMEKLELIIPLVTPFLDYFKNKKVMLVLPKDAVLSEESNDIIKEMNAKVYRMNGFMLDMLIIDEETVVIGVPDPARKNEVIALFIKNREFAKALKENVRKNIIRKDLD